MIALAPLDPRHIPLQGVQLIEASAGTGKTWTLAALYVRLVLGHGGQTEQLPAQILVVTFTRAATAELRERIRARLADAAAVFRDQLEADDFLRELLADYPTPADRTRAARRLELAAQWMDEAAVYTIHGWCQRMLAQHAYVGDESPDAIADEQARLDQAVRDYWRSFYATLDADMAVQIATAWQSPQELSQALRPLLRPAAASLRVGGESLPVVIDLSAALQQRSAAVNAAERTARAMWLQDSDAIEQAFARAVQTGALKANIYSAATLQRDLPAMRAWAIDSATATKNLLERHTQSKLDGSIRKGGSAPSHAAFGAIETLLTVQREQAPLMPLLIAHALPWVSERLELLREHEATLSFDDLLRQLDSALSGPQGSQLADTIARQFPLALIDEFQDTDPLQWRIFRTIYAERTDTGLLLIGDPKQAIYAFRGADIHTYLLARSEASSPSWTLTTNFRSTHELVGAINRVFEYADTQPLGAFAFDRHQGGLPFLPVTAKGLTRTLLLWGTSLPPLQLAVMGQPALLAGGSYIETSAGYAAAHIVELLNAAHAGACGLTDNTGQQQPLRARDIAILVRSGHEATVMREALQQRGVASVYLSDRDSVFASAQAMDLLIWLEACATPTSERKIRTALATASMSRSIVELQRFGEDELLRESCSEWFRECHRSWQRHGVLAMLHQLLHAFGLPARLLAKPAGERTLTNLQHLAELLQHAAAGLDGEHALIRYLATQITQSQSDTATLSDAQIVRLESEADVVRVVTVYKAKGLQYPVVLLPFVCRSRSSAHDDAGVWHDDDGVAFIDLLPNTEARQRIERERLQEDLRLLYVALTRAEHHCWLGIANLKDGNGSKPVLQRSAFGYVLSGGVAIEPADLLTHLQQLAAPTPAIQIQSMPEIPSGQMLDASQHPLPQRAARRYAFRPAQPWWIASYSALAHGATDHIRQIVPETAAQEVLAEAGREPLERDASGDNEGIHAFPRGAEPGTFLHDLLEWIAEEGFARMATNPSLLEQTVAQRCQRRDWQRWIVPLTRWLLTLLQTPLALPGAGTLSLDAVKNRHHYQAELEFWFEAHHVNSQELDALVTQYTLGGASRVPLSPSQVNGVLKGFIDLIVAHDGRYYIIDYKSNWLGPNSDAYTLSAMSNAALQARYDLQYALYTLALHRNLRARLPDYDYHRHMGGVMYLYLRGIDDLGHGVFTEQLPLVLIDAMDALFAGKENADAA